MRLYCSLSTVLGFVVAGIVLGVLLVNWGTSGHIQLERGCVADADALPAVSADWRAW
ncbi:hypothetical protein LWC34_26895 [Kibdelosporangium philippinense]|uniref:Uncharacterized protein n=1 Tax=Kibdelosporangium philippinense TaxID=211113 RepID=A0ABS8ZGJ4_9PSEU|nr:hypothetical protein [Kibdelosporangium philippinense]MCE7006429.1 hypothetical protein [Kibdelosporangium philippinense]